MLGLIRERFPTQKVYVVMADTGFEHVKPVPAVEWARECAASFGLPLDVVRNPNKTYLEMVANRRKFPSAGNRQCTADLKRGPVQKYIRHLPERIIINCTGIRAAESPQRAKQTPWEFDSNMSLEARVSKRNGCVTQLERKVWNWMPIFYESLRDVLEWHWLTDHPLHPIYIPAYHADGTTGGYLRRFSCRLCIFSTDADVRAIYHHDRQAFDLVSELEDRIGFTMKDGKSLFQIIQSPSRDVRQYGSEELYDTPMLFC
jgi:3'-phosphoadenosine 5'-phosphosulfate sulfotransferase (PAPS reductase)/FAD synthetase